MSPELVKFLGGVIMSHELVKFLGGSLCALSMFQVESSGHYAHISGSYLAQFTWEVDLRRTCPRL